VTCESESGEVLVAQALADEFGISRTPAHKALCGEGMLAIVPRSGYMISQMTIHDVQEMFQLRITLESLAAGLAAQHAPLRDLQLLWHETGSADDHDKPLSPGLETREWALRSINANRAFHIRVARMSHDRRLADSISRLIGESQQLLMRTPRLYEVMNDEHGEIIDALQRRAPRDAAQAMANHIEAAQSLILDSLRPGSGFRSMGADR
jgi:DNA-binding GntR family transcriptional regulator